MLFPFPTVMVGAAAAALTIVRSLLQTGSVNGFGGMTVRETVLAAGLVDKSASQIRITLRASNTSALNVTKAFVGRKGTNPGDFASTPTQIFFNGGSAGFTLSAGSGNIQASDWAPFAYTGTQDLVFMIYHSTTSGYVTNNADANSSAIWKAGDDTASLTVSGYSAVPVVNSVVLLIEAI